MPTPPGTCSPAGAVGSRQLPVRRLGRPRRPHLGPHGCRRGPLSLDAELQRRAQGVVGRGRQHHGGSAWSRRWRPPWSGRASTRRWMPPSPWPGSRWCRSSGPRRRSRHVAPDGVGSLSSDTLTLRSVSTELTELRATRGPAAGCSQAQPCPHRSRRRTSSPGRSSSRSHRCPRVPHPPLTVRPKSSVANGPVGATEVTVLVMEPVPPSLSVTVSVTCGHRPPRS